MLNTSAQCAATSELIPHVTMFTTRRCPLPERSPPEMSFAPVSRPDFYEDRTGRSLLRPKSVID